VKIRLPGVAKGDMAARNFKPEIRVFAVRFSPTGQAWAAATTEGLLIYSLDKGIVFDPYLLTEEVTPKAARGALANGDFSEALLMALKLNEANLLQDVIEHIPHREGEFGILGTTV
jgi:periodic tryptophan protein 2